VPSRTLTTSVSLGFGYDTVTWEGQTAHVIVIPVQLLPILLGLVLFIGDGLIYLRSRRRHASARRQGRSSVRARRPEA
jgi:hypothetical protein